MSTAQLGAPAARAVNATKTYGEGDTAVIALDDVSIDLHPGRFTAIMGPSGSGKSTLMHCLAGLDSLTSGQVFIGGVDLGGLSDRELTLLRRERVGFVFQAFNLLPTLNAEENIVLPLRLGGGRPDRAWFDLVVDTVCYAFDAPTQSALLGCALGACRTACDACAAPARGSIARESQQGPERAGPDPRGRAAAVGVAAEPAAQPARRRLRAAGDAPVRVASVPGVRGGADQGLLRRSAAAVPVHSLAGAFRVAGCPCAVLA